MVTNLGPEDLVLGLPWLRKMNPAIDWREGTLEMREGARQKEGSGHDLEVKTEQIAASRGQRHRWCRAKILEDPSKALWCAAGYTYSTELAERASKEKPQ